LYDNTLNATTIGKIWQRNRLCSLFQLISVQRRILPNENLSSINLKKIEKNAFYISQQNVATKGFREVTGEKPLFLKPLNKYKQAKY
jgi:hypothetical protein